jgi:ribosome-associated protein
MIATGPRLSGPARHLLPMPRPTPNPTAADTERGPSKTQRKRESHDLQRLGEALARLPDDRLTPLALPEGLHEALAEYRRTRSHEGRRRQLQYVGKLMRDVDPEPLREAVAGSRLAPARETLRLHEAERWRDALLADEAALTDWLQAQPGSDAQRLRSLLRAARREAALPAERRNPRPHRELYRFIHDALGADDHE